MQRIHLKLVATMASFSAAAQPAPELALLPVAPASINRLVVHGQGGTTHQTFILEAATNLIHWQEICLLHHTPFNFTDLATPGSATRFYRLKARPRTIQDDWKNQIQAPLVSEHLGWTHLDTEAEPFLSPPEDAYNGQPRWVKFTILSNEPARVFFQDSTRYPFHYEFATNRLALFKGLHRAAFDAAVLHPPTQRAVLGAVLFDTDQIVGTNCAIQFVGSSPYSRERIAELFNLVRSAIDAAPGVRFTYLPTFEQLGVAQTQRAWLADQGIELAELASGGSAQVEGWAIGRLRYIPTAEITSASMDGRLQPSDLLLTETLPAELPFLAGILTHAPATPNSHVVILAQSHAIPLAAVADISEFARLRQLDGVEVYLSVRNRTIVTPIPGELDSVSRAKLMELKEPPVVRILPKLAYGALSAPTDNLRAADSRFFGGKAAHYGLLRRTIPSNAPPAIAFSFDLWDAFLDQPLASGNTLRAEIAALLAPHQNYPPNLAALKTNLAAIRHLITDTARFNSAQRQAILNALNGFSPDRKLRFRSSSNAEDETNFSAAGLYDSFSGCLADDLDPDSVGPSACDPGEPNERGVLRAIQKVYASFYNDNAFLARRRHGIDELQVGMAVLVHHSFPDAEELANGVASVTLDQVSNSIGMTGTSIHLALTSQAGAVPVANPTTSAGAETVTFGLPRSWVPEPAPADFLPANPWIFSRSSLVTQGDTVMTWESDYRALADLLLAVALRYRTENPSRTRFTLNIEYKKIQPGTLVIKQVRELPIPTPPQGPAVYLLGETLTYQDVVSTRRGQPAWEGSDTPLDPLFGYHTLKTRWTLTSRSMPIISSNLLQGILEHARVEYVDQGQITSAAWTLTSTLASHHELQENAHHYRFQFGAEASQRSALFELIRPDRVGNDSPIVQMRNDQGWLHQSLSLATPLQVPAFGLSQDATNGRLQPHTGILTLNESTTPMRMFEEGWSLRPQVFEQLIETNGVSIRLRFRTDWEIGVIVPVETRIVGLISSPIVLEGFFAQTFGVYRHAGLGSCLLEPGLDPALPSSQRAELSQRNIRQIYLDIRPRLSLRNMPPGSNPSALLTVQVLGFNNEFRPLQ